MWRPRSQAARAGERGCAGGHESREFSARPGGVAGAGHRLDCEAVLAVNPPARRERRRHEAPAGWRRAALLLGVVIAGGCFKDLGPDLQTTSGLTSTVIPDTSTGGETLPTGETSAASTSSSTTAASETTGATLAPGIAFRLSSLDFVDPHVFLTEGGGDTGTTGDPLTCTDATMFLNSALNADIADGGFSLMMYFEELEAGAELRLFEGECSRPDEASMWTCTRKDGSLQTIFDTEQVLAPPCRDFDVSRFQMVNVPLLSDPTTPCVRTEQLDFSIPVSNSAGSLNLREAQMVAAPDDLMNPTGVPSGVIYGFLPMQSASGIEIMVPLFGVINLWEAIDVPGCAVQYPDQLPSVEELDLGDGPILGVWLGINFTAERVLYAL